MATSDQVQQLYITYFGRPADPAGLEYWTSDETTPISEIANGFAATPEYADDVDGLSIAQVINDFYLNLFGRNAEVGGLNFWVQQVQLGNTTLQAVGLEIGTVALVTPGNDDGNIVRSKISASDEWTAQVALSTQGILAYTGQIGIDAGVEFLIPVVSTATIPTEEETAAAVDLLIEANGGGVPQTLNLTIFSDTADGDGTIRFNQLGTIVSESTFKFTAQNQIVNATQLTLPGANALGDADTLVDISTLDEDVINIADVTDFTGFGGDSTVANIENVNIALSEAEGVYDGNGEVVFTGVQAFTFTGTVGAATTFNIAGIASGATLIDSTAVTESAAAATFAITTSNTATRVNGGAADENITGGNGNDTISSGAGNDTVAGGNGDDLIVSASGNNRLSGETGADTIRSGAGSDTITGGFGNDAMTTGDGVDTVVQNANGISNIATATTFDADMDGGETATFAGGVDIVTDFNAAFDFIQSTAAGIEAENFGFAANFDAEDLEANESFALRGDFNTTTNVFTYNVAGADVYYGFNTAADITAVGNQGTRSAILVGGAAGFTGADVIA